MICINCGRKYQQGSKNYIKVLENNNQCIYCKENINLYLNKKLLSKEYSEGQVKELERGIDAHIYK